MWTKEEEEKRREEKEKKKTTNDPTKITVFSFKWLRTNSTCTTIVQYHVWCAQTHQINSHQANGFFSSLYFHQTHSFGENEQSDRIHRKWPVNDQVVCALHKCHMFNFSCISQCI